MLSKNQGVSRLRDEILRGEKKSESLYSLKERREKAFFILRRNLLESIDSSSLKVASRRAFSLPL
jgi:hypothetical protein